MLSPVGIIKPVDELMQQEQSVPFSSKNFLPVLRDFYSKAGRLQAIPFNTSIPVIYYNADRLAQVGVTKSSFPKTWQAMERLAAKLHEAGLGCAYTSAYPSWIHIESFAALHGLPMVDATHSQAIYNSVALTHHLERLKKWQTLHYFEYGGRTNDATILFTSGRCAMFGQSSGSYNSLRSVTGFKLGVAALPLEASVSDFRHNNVIGGAALWAVAGHTSEVYQGIALFFAYIVQPIVQHAWHQKTWYLPLGISGYYAFLLVDKPQPTLSIAYMDLASVDAHLLNPDKIPQNQIRMINDEAIEAIFADIKRPKDALDDAVKRANLALLRFVRNTGVKKWVS